MTREVHQDQGVTFFLNEDNYLEFLESILDKHGQTQYKFSPKQWFSFKFTMPKLKKYIIALFSVQNLTTSF